MPSDWASLSRSSVERPIAEKHIATLEMLKDSQRRPGESLLNDAAMVDDDLLSTTDGSASSCSLAELREAFGLHLAYPPVLPAFDREAWSEPDQPLVPHLQMPRQVGRLLAETSARPSTVSSPSHRPVPPAPSPPPPIRRSPPVEPDGSPALLDPQDSRLEGAASRRRSQGPGGTAEPGKRLSFAVMGALRHKSRNPGLERPRSATTGQPKPRIAWA
eukprot:gnl/TRDRNA2_/TRDRNA2_184351_c0_seq1.p1 gnl/TRDRNA2_/TRDRNA2_184351_c0~~gnl/TRDRNA2_/TRDRNA2_184351_c0_seq1.p1  ORF type:complete len:217 (+),score=19.54 gnl/TRDRNA2_/TRDRNA2_184351_c0_seq1:89-739(+)